MEYGWGITVVVLAGVLAAGCSSEAADASDGGVGGVGASGGSDGSGANSADGGVGAAAASGGSDGSGTNGGQPVPCDPLLAEEQPITLSDIPAVGEAEDGTLFVVDSTDEAELRVFVSNGNELRRVRVLRGGESGSPGVEEYVFTFEAPGGGSWTLAIEIRDGETRMAVVTDGEFEGRSFDEVIAAGNELTVRDKSALSGLELQNLPGEIEVEYMARTEDGDQLVVTRPRDDWSYEDFRLFYGEGTTLTERAVSNVLRARDGGTTWITFELDGSEAEALFPASLTEPAETPTLTVEESTVELTLLDPNTDVAGLSFRCFPAPGQN